MKKLSRSPDALRVEPKSDVGFRYTAYPVHQLIRSRAHAFQLAFAREAIARLGEPPEDLVYEPSHRGLDILGLEERMLAMPVEAISGWYGSTVVVGWPRVRYQLGETVQEPIMSLVVRGPRRLASRVKNDLLRRGSEAVDIEMYPNRFIVRTRATQAELLGYHSWLKKISEQRAHVYMWLSHYAPVQQGPGPAVA